MLKNPSIPRTSIACIAVLSLAACAPINPKPYSQAELSSRVSGDKAAAQQDVEPIAGKLTLDGALARALKYNLDRRARLMEEALAFRMVDASHYDMLPKLLAQAGYSWRSNERISQSRNDETGELSPSRFISQEPEHNMASLGVTWNLLDFGMGYYNTRQQADRVLIASEKRRKAMHVLMQDVRTAFWRAASAQKLQAEVRAAQKLAEEALADSRKTETEQLRNPVNALRYQRQVLENLRLLEAIDQELSTAKLELASLINAPIGQDFELVEDGFDVNRDILQVRPETMEEIAMVSNADIREQLYNGRIAREETRKTLVRLFPNLSFNYGASYDDDNYLVNENWNEAGVQLSFNLFNLLSGPTQMKLADAGVELADQRRLATQMAVLAQVHIGRLQLANTVKQFERADAIWNTDRRIAEHMSNSEMAQTQTKLDAVANQTTAILSLLRRYQALAQVHAAEAKLQSTLGVEPAIGSVDETTLTALGQQIRDSATAWKNLGWTDPATQRSTESAESP